MKIYGSIYLALFILQAGITHGQNAPTGLMTEFIREPAGVPVLDLNPEFSWIVPSGAKYQEGYQILVASSEEKLAKNTGDVWDSKKIQSSRSNEIEFGGKSLSASSTFYWKVRIWNEKDKPSKYSEIQSFTTGNPAGYTTTRNRFMTPLIEPATFIKTDESEYFADFGRDAFGTLVLNITPEREQVLRIRLGEKTGGTNKIDSNPGGSLRYQEVSLAVKPGTTVYTLDLPADSRNTGPAAIHLPDSVGVVTPFRYCVIEDCPLKIGPASVRQKALWYYFDDHKSYFTSTDTVLNSVWDMCKYSMKATSFTGIYVDGDRERIPYEADAYINQLGHYYTDREYSLARLTNEYFIKHPTWPTEWILQTVPMFYNDLLFTGNSESARHYYEELKHKTLTSLAREDGLISSKNCTDEIMRNIGFSDAKERLRDIVDWPPSQQDTGWKLATPEGERDGYEMVDVNTVVNAFYYHGLDLMSKIAAYLGEDTDSQYYSNLATMVKKTINEKLLDKTTGIYIDGESSTHSSLHANMMTLAFGLVPAENMEKVISFIKSRGMACSVYGAQYLMEGLFNAGEADYALSLLTATNDRSWWNMIRSGSTITMEAWDMKYKPNSDWNHAWGAAPANIIPGYMWGIRPLEPGWAKALIRPQPGDLKNSTVSVPTIRGNIIAGYVVNGNSKKFTIIIPANIESDFVITGYSRDKMNGKPAVHLNGKLMEAAPDTIRLKPGKNIVVIKPI